MTPNEYNAKLKSSEESWKKKINADLKGKKSWEDFSYRITDDIHISPIIHGRGQRISLTNSTSQWLSVFDDTHISGLGLEEIGGLGIDVLISKQIFNQDSHFIQWKEIPKPEKKFLNSYEDSHGKKIDIIMSLHEGDSIQKCTDLLLNLHSYLTFIYETKDRNEFANREIVLKIMINDSFYDSISLLQSLHTLGKEIFHEWDIPQENLKIMSNLSISQSGDSLQHRQIGMTTQVIASILGNADYIFMPKLSNSHYTSARMSANVHHLLRMESHLSYVNNMLDGSYFFEELINAMQTHIWNKFLENVS